ncbi:hypothetical protein ACFWE0_27205 [Streptomyces diastaticus]|uniref:helix-turn-helix transcriptional regulator n=1 Tax=Streptomyces diastaticus TaxID=1956 RepID=UPI0036511A52
MLSKDLGPEQIATYRAIAIGNPPEVGPATEQLAELGLIEWRPHEGTWVAHDPRATARGLMGEALEELAELVTRIRRVPTLDALASDYDPHRMYGGPASEFLASRAAMNDRIGQVAASTSISIMTAQPGEPADRDPQIVALGVQRTIDVLHAGTEVRGLYNSLAATHPQTAASIDTMVDAGSAARTMSGSFPRMMIFDSRHLFIDNHVVSGAEADSGWHVTDRGSVAWAVHVFDALWNRAARWSSVPVGGATTGRQRQILVELEAGYTTQQAARRLGLGERTITKELSALRSALGMRTLYQVMVWWATSPDRDLP